MGGGGDGRTKHQDLCRGTAWQEETGATQKKLGDKPRNVENYAYWRDFLIVAGTSIRLPVIIGCLV